MKKLYEQLPERICAWYAQNHRELPWRETRDPYLVWVSEIMLQQTRVEAVKPYYIRFTEELPDVETLSTCPEDRLLKLWEGLGYYSRVRHMQEAARLLVQEQAPEGKGKVSLPDDPAALRRLPGIGSYTAGAIASIAYQIRVPAVDGNVLRILARLQADERDVRKASVKREAESRLQEALQSCSTPGDFNQGLMDRGAGVCLPQVQPLCEACPLADLCEAHRQEKETAFPVRSKAKDRRIEQRTILLIRDGDRVVLTRRPAKGLLAGLYEFPNLPGFKSRQEVLQTAETMDLQPLYIRELDRAKHLFSHVEWQMCGYEIRIAGFTSAGTSAAAPWFLAEIRQMEKEYPIPSAYKAYAKYLQ